MHPQRDPLKWEGGRGRGGAEGLREWGWKHSQKSCPVVGIGMGGHRFWHLLGRGWGRLRAPHTPGRGEPGGSGGSVPLLPQGPREPGRCPAGPWPGAPREGAGSWEGGPRARGPAALRPSAGATVPPPAAGGRSCPSSASPRRDRSSRTGKSAGKAPLEPPRPLRPRPFTPKLLQPRFSGLGAEPGYFYPSIFHMAPRKSACASFRCCCCHLGEPVPPLRLRGSPPESRDGEGLAANYAIRRD